MTHVCMAYMNRDPMSAPPTVCRWRSQSSQVPVDCSALSAWTARPSALRSRCGAGVQQGWSYCYRCPHATVVPREESRHCRLSFLQLYCKFDWLLLSPFSCCLSAAMWPRVFVSVHHAAPDQPRGKQPQVGLRGPGERCLFLCGARCCLLICSTVPPSVRASHLACTPTYARLLPPTQVLCALPAVLLARRRPRAAAGTRAPGRRRCQGRRHALAPAAA